MAPKMVPRTPRRGTSTAVEPRRLDVQVRTPTKTHPLVKHAGRHAPGRRVVTTVPEVLAPVINHGDPVVVTDFHQLVLRINIVVTLSTTERSIIMAFSTTERGIIMAFSTTER